MNRRRSRKKSRSLTGKEQADLPDKEEIPELPSVSDQMKDAGTDLKEEKDRQERAEETKEDRRETAGEKDRTEDRALEKEDLRKEV